MACSAYICNTVSHSRNRFFRFRMLFQTIACCFIYYFLRNWVSQFLKKFLFCLQASSIIAFFTTDICHRYVKPLNTKVFDTHIGHHEGGYHNPSSCLTMALIHVFQILFENKVCGVKYQHFYNKIVNKISLQIWSSYSASWSLMTKHFYYSDSKH